MADDEQKSSGEDVAPPGNGNGQNSAHRTSPKQLAANRRNAMLSTGPRTPGGKRASKFNATKHGLRAREIVIPGQENRAEFEVLLEELRDDWKPEGQTETNLVAEIAVAEWRLRRARRAELGEIQTRIKSAVIVKRDPARMIDRVLRTAPAILPKLLPRSTTGILLLQNAVAKAFVEIKTKSIVSRETYNNLVEMFGDTEDNPALKLKWLYEKQPLLEKFKDVNLERFRLDKKAAALKDLEQHLRDLERLMRKVHRKEKLEREIELHRLSVPNGPKLEHLQRYETAIKRDLYRSIDLLERLQRRRRGEPPPPTVNVKVSRDD